jgi:hypothetical protein
MQYSIKMTDSNFKKRKKKEKEKEKEEVVY